MGVYSNTEIHAAIENGSIICMPFNDKHISEASLDITLGYYYYQSERQNERTVYNPFDREQVERYFDGPYEAMEHHAWCDLYGQRYFQNIPLDHPIIVIKPGQRILAHTHEFVGIRPQGGACEIRSRSTMGRNGIAVCFDAGWIDPGYINRITLEIYNLNQHEAVVLPVGERVGQIIFHHTGQVEGDYGNSRGGMSGKYQQGSDLDTLIRTWTPDQMLPKSYKDTRHLPLPIEGLGRMK
jgi:deoxycytidine triphosphate deaminase